MHITIEDYASESGSIAHHAAVYGFPWFCFTIFRLKAIRDERRRAWNEMHYHYEAALMQQQAAATEQETLHFDLRVAAFEIF